MALTRTPDIDRMRRAKAGWIPAAPAQRRFKSGGGSAPTPPDPGATAAAQSAANKEAVLESAKVNQIGQVTPYGEVKYTGEIGSPDRTMTTTLSESGQKQLDQQNALALQLGDIAKGIAGKIPSDTLNFDNLPTYSSGIDLSLLPKAAGTGDYSADEQRAEEAAFNRAWGRLAPQFEQEQTALQTQLANQGIGIGTDAYTRALADFDRNKNDARIAASYDAINAGQALNQNLFNNTNATRTAALNEALQNASMGNAARLEGITEKQTLRNAPMNELAAILQGQPALTSPNFGAPAQYQVAPADVQGAVANNYAGQQAAYNTKVGQGNAITASTAGLLGTAGMAAAMF